MFESTAVWSEEQVFPNDDDWLAYLDVLDAHLAQADHQLQRRRRPARLRQRRPGTTGSTSAPVRARGGPGTHGRARARRTRRPSRWRTIARSAGTGARLLAGVRPLPRRPRPSGGSSTATSLARTRTSRTRPSSRTSSAGKAASGQQGEPVQPRPHGVQAPSSQAGRGRRPGAAGEDSARRAQRRSPSSGVRAVR